MSSAVLVVGMGRSGTSALTRVLSLCGATLPRRLMMANHANPRGYYEAQKAVEINEDFLGQNSSSWFDPTLRLQQKSASDLIGMERFRTDIGDFILDDFAASPFIVLKDPRITGLLPFWIEALRLTRYDITAVVSFRSPDSVAASLQRRDDLSRDHARALWLKYNLLAERHTRHLPRCFVNYDDLVADWRSVVMRICRATGLPLDRIRDAEAIDRFLTPELRHHMHGGSIEPPDPGGWLSSVHGALKTLAEGHPCPTELFDRVYAAFEAQSDTSDPLDGSDDRWPGNRWSSRP